MLLALIEPDTVADFTKVGADLVAMAFLCCSGYKHGTCKPLTWHLQACDFIHFNSDAADFKILCTNIESFGKTV